MITYEDIYFGTKKAEKIEQRINDLVKNRRYIEAILWFATIFEAEATILLSINEKIIKEIGTKNNSLIKNFSPRDADNIRKENKTLGGLKKELEKFYRNQSLIKELDDFIYLRNFIFHKIFETKITIKYIEENIIKRAIKDCYKLRHLLLKELNTALKEYVQLLENKEV